MEEVQELKPSKQEKAIFIEQMQATPGWKLIEHYLKQRLEVNQENLEVEQGNELYKLQGRVAELKDFKRHLKEYATWKQRE